MKKIHSSLIAAIAFVVFAGLAFADAWDKVITKKRFVVLTGFNDDQADIFVLVEDDRVAIDDAAHRSPLRSMGRNGCEEQQANNETAGAEHYRQQ